VRCDKTVNIYENLHIELLIQSSGKPIKPTVAGPNNATENSDVTLTCSSTSTSRPSYYAKLVSLTYTWYTNNTVMMSETRGTLIFRRVSRDDRFNRYSCQARESLLSEKSDEIIINVLCEYSALIEIVDIYFVGS
jgi:hypothetical protein